MEESILLGAPLKMEGQNQPTRVGEIVNTFADIANIINPCEGMTVFVRDEQASYRVLSLKAKTISGVSVANAQVDKVEKCIDNKRITGTSPDSNALTDPFKSLGVYNSKNIQELWNALDALCGTDANKGCEGVFRARYDNSVIEVFSAPMYYAGNQWLQVLKGRFAIDEDGELLNGVDYNILQRVHDVNGWSDWVVVAGGKMLATMNAQIADVEKKITALIGESPEALDTIHEIADWILNDENGAAAMMQQISTLQSAVKGVEVVADDSNANIVLSDFKGEKRNANIPAATTTKAGVMSAQDKQMLNTVVEDNETQDEQIATLQGQVAALSSGLKLSATLSPSVVYRGEDSAITVTPTLANNAGIVKADVLKTILGVEEQSANNVAYTEFYFNAKIAEPDASVTSSAIYNGMTLTTKNTLYARYPIFMGAGSEPSGVYGTEFKQSERTSARGYTYKTTTNSNYQRFYLLVPTDVTQPTAFSMGGAPFAMGETTDVTLNGISYKVYKSANAYNSGTVLEIKVE